MGITAKDRSALLRMAGNIAAGLAPAYRIAGDCPRCGAYPRAKDAARDSVTLALAILEDERLKVDEGKE
jgi:hypothetical protein